MAKRQLKCNDGNYQCGNVCQSSKRKCKSDVKSTETLDAFAKLVKERQKDELRDLKKVNKTTIKKWMADKQGQDLLDHLDRHIRYWQNELALEKSADQLAAGLVPDNEPDKVKATAKEVTKIAGTLSLDELDTITIDEDDEALVREVFGENQQRVEPNLELSENDAKPIDPDKLKPDFEPAGTTDYRADAGEFGAHFDGIPDDMANIYSRIGSARVRTDTADPEKGLYVDATSTVVLGESFKPGNSVAGKAVVLHEYGHHLDAELARRTGQQQKARIDAVLASLQQQGIDYDKFENEQFDLLTAPETLSDEKKAELADTRGKINEAFASAGFSSIANANIAPLRLSLTNQTQTISSSPAFANSIGNDTRRLFGLSDGSNWNPTSTGLVRVNDGAVNREGTKLSDEGSAVLKELARNPGLEVLQAKNEPELIAGALESYVSRASNFETEANPMAYDLIGAATLNMIGYGHTDEYYQKAGDRRFGETFANIAMFHSLNDPVVNRALAYLMPESYEQFTKALADALDD